jgi:hypothetical protein
LPPAGFAKTQQNLPSLSGLGRFVPVVRLEWLILQDPYLYNVPVVVGFNSQTDRADRGRTEHAQSSGKLFARPHFPKAPLLASSSGKAACS